MFRTSQRYIERELGSVQIISNDLAKQARQKYEPASALSAIDSMLGKVENLKRKVSLYFR